MENTSIIAKKKPLGPMKVVTVRLVTCVCHVCIHCNHRGDRTVNIGISD